jgi:mono/diheme cytochrome c family protein/HEAT repeat protein
LWVLEMVGYMNDIQATGEHNPVGRVVVLEDTDGDGAMDKRTVFADGLVLPRALKVLAHGVLVGEPPNLWLMKDTNGDLKADTKELVTNAFGRLDANVEHNANGLLWALDNRIYTSEVDLQFRFENGKLDVRRTIARGQWGATQDDAGHVFRNSNESALHADLVPTSYFARNPALIRTRGSDEFLGGTDEALNTVWPVRPTRGVNRGYQAGILRADGTLAKFTSACSPTVYRGDRLPSELYGNVFVAEPAGNLVSRIVVTDDGQTLRGRKAYPRGEFLASTDERFRPVYLSSAPDGTLYVVDMYRGVVQHRGYITEYLRDQILSRHLEQPIGRGRIYRIVHDTTKRDVKPSLSDAPVSRLVELLSHPNGWWRDTAQRLLVERGDRSAVEPLRRLADGAPQARTRLQALWTLDGLNSLEAADVTRALADRSRDVRVAGIRLSERWLHDGNVALQTAVRKLASDPDWEVREQLGASLGEMPADAKEKAIVEYLDRNAGDPVAMDAALSGLKGSEASVLDDLLKTREETPQRTAAMAMLAATIVSSDVGGGAVAVLDSIAQADNAGWQRSALLRGAEVAVLDEPAPGSSSRPARGRGEACPTCPGARGGPGGAAAFPRGTNGDDVAEGSARGAGGRGGGRRGQRPTLTLTREPQLTKLAAAQGDPLSARARAVLARVTWPGKPGAAVAAAAPLSAAEQARFAAGREVYQNLCSACHQPNGRGLDRVAPALVGSEFALDPAGVPIRILLNGKEGSVGLMPPLGYTLSDDQIAAVLTYVRHEWGQTASAVDPALVSEIRAATAGRTRPWTNDELRKIAPGQ